MDYISPAFMSFHIYVYKNMVRFGYWGWINNFLGKLLLKSHTLSYVQYKHYLCVYFPLSNLCAAKLWD